MQIIWGRETWSEPGEIVDPDHTALLLIDLQNDFCHPDGHDARGGADLSLIASALPRIAGLLLGARQAGVRVIWVQQTLEDHALADSPAWLRRRTRGGALTPAWTVRGSWGEQLVEPFTKYEREITVWKHRSSAFTGSSLDLMLRSSGTRSVVIAGVMTQGCVESTARDATFMDYYVVLARDCVASVSRDLHDASLICQSTRYDIDDSGVILRCWNQASATAGLLRSAG